MTDVISSNKKRGKKPVIKKRNVISDTVPDSGVVNYQADNWVEMFRENWELFRNSVGEMKDQIKAKTYEEYQKGKQYIMNEWDNNLGIPLKLAAGDIKKIQEKLDILSDQAIKKKPFSDKDKDFLKNFYEWLAFGGKWAWANKARHEFDEKWDKDGFDAVWEVIDIIDKQSEKGLWEAGDLMGHYLGKTGDELEIDSYIYANSVIVKYAMNEIKKLIKKDIQLNGIISKPVVNSPGVLKGTPRSFQQQKIKGKILSNGYLLCEQNNKRLFFADNRFPLNSTSSIRSMHLSKQGKMIYRIQTIWSVESIWDYVPYSEQKKDEYITSSIPLPKGRSLSLQDGLSQYLEELDLARIFKYTAKWIEDYEIEILK